MGVAENLFVEFLDGNSAGDGVKGRIVLGVAQSHLNDGLVEGVSGNAVEEGYFHLCLQQGCPGDGVIQPAG